MRRLDWASGKHIDRKANLCIYCGVDAGDISEVCKKCKDNEDEKARLPVAIAGPLRRGLDFNSVHRNFIQIERLIDETE